MKNPSNCRLSVWLLTAYSLSWTVVGGVALLLVYAAPVSASAQPDEVLSFNADSSSEFSASCVALPGVLAAPAIDNLTVSPAKGGELRLKATLEDYFDAPQIDTTKWISGYSNPAFNLVPMPQIVAGALRLDANYLRSAERAAPGVSARFFEARVQFVVDGLPLAYGDIGFYRSHPPLIEDPTNIGSIRLFVAQTVPESDRPRHMYVRSRNGTMLPSTPLDDTVVDNWGVKEAIQKAALAKYHDYRIEWESGQTDYLIDGTQIVTAAVGTSVPLPHRGDTTLDTYVFLYSQDPSFFAEGRSPVLVDWVRAGQYAAQGSYTSCVHDAGAPVNWSRATISATVPVQSAAQIETRTSGDGATWSAWRPAQAVTGGQQLLALNNPGGRYFQYRVTLTSSDPMQTPEVESFAAAYFQPSAVSVQPGPALVTPGQVVTFTATVLDGNGEAIEDHPETVTWSVVAGGGAIDNSGVFVAGVQRGSYDSTIEARVGSTLVGRATVIVDEPPIGNAGPDYQGNEGEPVALTAAGSFDPYGRALSYAWDLDGDGIFDDAMGAGVTFAWPDDGQYFVRLLVTNTVGFTDTAESAVFIANVPPAIRTITHAAVTRLGDLVEFVVEAEDVAADPLQYAFDWNDDGVFDTADQPSNIAAQRFDRLGSATVAVRVRDDDGGESIGGTSVTVVEHRVYLPLTAR